MKKLLKILLLMIMFIPLIAKADMGAPSVRPYEAEVVKEEIDYYEYKSNNKIEKAGTLEKGTKVKIVYEVTNNGQDYLDFQEIDGSKEGYIKVGDVMPIKEKVTMSDEGVSKTKSVKFMVYADEVEMRQGPSKSYKVSGVLKKGTTGVYQYYIEESPYIYVEVNGVAGWIDRLDRAVLTKTDEEYSYVLGKSLSTSCGTIPANTKLKGEWEAMAWDSLNYQDGTSLVKYNGCETFIPTFKSEKVGIYEKNTAGENERILIKDVKVYEDIDLKKQVGTIPANTIPEAFAFNGVLGPSTFYIEYKGIKGWAEEMVGDEFVFANTSEVKTKDDKPEEEPKEEETKEEEPKKEEKPEEKKEEKKEDKEDKKESKNMDSRTLGIICVVVGLALALAGVTTIVLINKNKGKAAPVAPKEEVKEEKDFRSEEEKAEEELAEKNIAEAEKIEAEEKAAKEKE